MAAPASAASSTPVSTRVPRAGISELWHDKAAAIGLAFILPATLAYTAYSYWVFRGKVREGEGYH